MTQSNGSGQRLVFQFEWRLTLATALLLPLLVSLGFWQLSRADEKAALQARDAARLALPPVTPAALLKLGWEARADRQVVTSIAFSAGDYVLLDNRIRNGRVGFDVVALGLAGGVVVPVNLGWIAGDPARRTLPDVVLPVGGVMLQGRVHIPSGDAYVLASEAFPDALPAVVQALPLADWKASVEAKFSAPLFPHEVRVEPTAEFAFEAGWPVVNQTPEKHTAYAVQWFTMAAALLVAFALRSTNLLVWLKRPA